MFKFVYLLLTAFIIFIFFTAGFILRMGLVGVVGGLQNTSEQFFISLHVLISWHTLQNFIRLIGILISVMLLLIYFIKAFQFLVYNKILYYFIYY
jgi:hypothetical protein